MSGKAPVCAPPKLPVSYTKSNKYGSVSVAVLATAALNFIKFSHSKFRSTASVKMKLSDADG